MKTKTLIRPVTVSLLLLFAVPQSAGVDWLKALTAVGKSAQAYTLTNDDVVALVGESVKKMDATNNVAPATSKYTKRLNNLTSAFKKVDGVPLNFKVYITNDVNAFACPDGSVRVYSALMDMMTDDELIGIIGHEIGHVGKHHSLKALKQSLLNSALVDAAGSVSTTVNHLSEMGLVDLGLAAASAKYSRKQEREADDYAYDFLKKCNKNPYSLVIAFEKMQSLSSSHAGNTQISNYINRMFSTHPQMEERISRIKKRCKRDGYTM